MHSLFQSTHPHGVRPTETTIGTRRDLNFNPRTRMGCDIKHRPTASTPRAFQSTHPHGVRRIENAVPAIITRISIHAPAWGATSRLPRRRRLIKYFNPRTRMGCDHSARPRGDLCPPDFNPRTRMGCDYISDPLPLARSISIHAPAWGATQMLRKRSSMLRNFNPRTRMGCDIAQLT